MPIDLYYKLGSSPCRGVLLAAKALGVELNLKLTELQKGEHLTPEFLKINPTHSIPTLVDNGFALSESRAIITYLADQYGKNDSLYPRDPKKRAQVDQRLYFDIGTLAQRFGDYYYPVIFGNASFDPQNLEKCNEAFQFLDKFLEGQEYVANNQLSVADLSLLATVSTYEACSFDLSPYKNVTKWFTNLKTTLPYYEVANGDGATDFKQLAARAIKK